MSQNTTQIQEQPTFEVPFERGWSMFDGDELDAAHYERTDYEEGYLDGKDTAEQQLTQVLKEEREKTAISVQKAYDKGKIEGAEALREDFQIFEKKLEEKVAELEQKNAELRQKMHKMYNELQDDLEEKDKEIENLRTQLAES